MNVEELKEHVLKLLRSEEPVDIVFEKKDKSLREMRCSRHLDHVPTDKKPHINEGKDEVKGLNIPVFDLDANGWRSFTLKNLKEINGESVVDMVNDAFTDPDEK